MIQFFLFKKKSEVKKKQKETRKVQLLSATVRMFTKCAKSKPINDLTPFPVFCKEFADVLGVWARKRSS